jgi:hypothetical protein
VCSHAVYVRGEAHGHIEYYSSNATSAPDAGIADKVSLVHARSGCQACAKSMLAHDKDVHLQVSLVHALQCCPHYHAAVDLRWRRPQRERGGEGGALAGAAARCDAFVEYDSYLFGVVNAYQYGHLLHETVMALFHTILTFSGLSEGAGGAGGAGSAGGGGEGAGTGAAELGVEDRTGKLSNAFVLISDVMDAEESLEKLMALLQSLSDLPWLSISALRRQGRTVCFHRIVIGLSDGMNMFATAHTAAAEPNSSPVARPADVRRLRAHVFRALGFRDPPVLSEAARQLALDDSPRRVAFIHRASDTRRGIHNAEDLMAVAAAWGAEAFAIEYDAISFLEQVDAMQRVTVVVGVTGTGLWNALWMRSGGLGVQLFPFGVGFKGGIEFEHAIRHGPGHYSAWHSPRYFKATLFFNGKDSCAAPRGCSPEELLSPALNLPAIAVKDPPRYWAQDWGGAWLLYYGQDALYVDPRGFADILERYQASEGME